MHSFPSEIIAKIGRCLDQVSCLNFALTCKGAYEVLIPNLYYAINIDASKSVLSQDDLQCDFSVPELKGSHKVRPTTISKIYSLKLFFKTLMENPSYARFIRKIVFNPDTPDIGEVCVIQNLICIFPYMYSLKSFQWFNYNYSIAWSLLSKLPDVTNLLELNGNFDLDVNLPLFKVRSLNISNFKFANYLTKFNLMEHPDLEELVISRSSTGSNSFLYFNEPTQPTNINEIDFISKLFENYIKVGLNALTIKDVPLRAEDATLLMNGLDNLKLKELSILNCHEMMFDDDQLIRRTPPSICFMNILSFPNLETLNLKITSDFNFNYPIFDFIKSHVNLKNLNIHLQLGRHENINLCLKYLLECIPGESLTFLDLKFDFTDCVSKYNSSNYSVHSLSALVKFKKLNYLCLQINQYQVSNLFNLIRPLKNLKCLKLKINNSNLCHFAAHENSLVNKECYPFSYPRFKDTYFEFSNLAHDFKLCVPSLHWIHLHVNSFASYIFECGSEKVTHREGVANVFDKIVHQCIRS